MNNYNALTPNDSTHCSAYVAGVAERRGEAGGNACPHVAARLVTSAGCLPACPLCHVGPPDRRSWRHRPPSKLLIICLCLQGKTPNVSSQQATCTGQPSACTFVQEPT